MYEISRKYRTAHSLNDNEVSGIISYFQKLASPATFLDYGCHLGHLSIEMAIRFPINVLAVDTFAGTLKDNYIIEGGSFQPLFEQAVKETCDLLLGKIEVMSPEELFSKERVVDMAFIDSSHEIKDANEFVKIGKMITKEGIIGGHDYTKTGIGVRTGVKLLKKDFEHLPGKKGGSACFFMRRKAR